MWVSFAFCALEFYLNVLVEVYFKGFWFDGGMILDGFLNNLEISLEKT